METTSVYGFPYPVASVDPPNGAGQTQALAEAVEAVLVSLLRPAVEAEENNAGTTGSATFTATLSGATTPAVVFVAPSSGKVAVTWTCSQLNDVTNSTYSSFEVRTGSSIGGGSVFMAADDNRAVLTDPSDPSQNVSTGTIRKLVVGLTPGATYHARGMYHTNGGNGTYRQKRITVEPTF